MTLAELSSYDGRENRRAYIAVNGTIYDVTDSPHWENGLHPPDHLAGKDLTEELSTAPHVRTVVERFPIVGTLEDETPQQTSAGNKSLIIGVIIAIAIGALIVLMLF